MKKYLIFGILVAHSSFAAELTAPMIDTTNFLPSIQIVLNDVNSPKFNSSICVPYLKSLENQILNIDVRKISAETFNEDAQKIADTSWLIQDSLHARLGEFDLNCINQVQSNFRQFRFIGDYVLERTSHVKDMYPEGKDFEKELLVPMKDKAPYYVFNRRLQDKALENELNFKPGDLLIARGLSFLSAMIARLGSRGTQFSHIVMLAEDGPVTNMAKIFMPMTQRTIESYVGSGVAFYQIEDALKNENARLIWLRSKDENLSKKAANLMSNEVSQLSAKGDKIFYDYQLDFKNHDTMSCAEVAQTAYERASNGEVHLPMYENEVKGASSLLLHIGLPAGKTFEPGDMEVDPRFEMMGEFRDLRLTRDSRHKDVIMSKVFQWMDERGYQLHDSMKSKMAGGIIYDIRHTFMWPLVKKVLKINDFSREIPRKMVRTVELLNELGNPMLEKLRQADDAFKQKTGWSMTYQELYQTMEDFRAEDEALYMNRKTRKQSKFHKLFRGN